MSKKRKEEEQRRKQESRKRTARSALIAAGVVCVCGLLFAVLYRSLQPKTIAVTLQPDGSLSIPYSKIGSKMAYVDFGGSQDLLVWIDGAGDAMTAYDTCEECYGEGAHYIQSGDQLTCQSCGNSVPLSTLGSASWGGCQPVAIPVSYRQDEGGNIVIPAAVLDYAGDVFASWRAGDYSVRLSGYGDQLDTSQSDTPEAPEGEGEEEEQD